MQPEPAFSATQDALAQVQPGARLCSFEVENFRLFRRERLEVHPEVTLLVGLNDVGKSTLLEAIRLYGVVQRQGFRRLLSSDDFRPMGTEATRLTAVWEVEGRRWTHTLVMHPSAAEERLESGGSFWSWKPRSRSLSTPEGSFEAEGLQRYASLATIGPSQWQLDTDVEAHIYEPTAVTRSFQTPPAYLFEPQALAETGLAGMENPARNGFGWASWLQALINRRDGSVEALEGEVRALFPYFSGVRVRTVESTAELPIPAVGSLMRGLEEIGKTTATERWLELEISVVQDPSITDGRLQIAPEHASSGLLLALAHLALVHAMPEGALLLLEEPENGLNARITLDMMRTFLAAVRRRRQQLILTTHNAWWLDLVPADSIRVITRDERGSHIHMPPAERLRSLLEEQDLYPSEVMGTYGPEGLLYLDRPKA